MLHAIPALSTFLSASTQRINSALHILRTHKSYIVLYTQKYVLLCIYVYIYCFVCRYEFFYSSTRFCSFSVCHSISTFFSSVLSFLFYSILCPCTCSCGSWTAAGCTACEEYKALLSPLTSDLCLSSRALRTPERSSARIWSDITMVSTTRWAMPGKVFCSRSSRMAPSRV